MTKQDLLDKMQSLSACEQATSFVRYSPLKSAKEIWLSCERVDWLCWLAFRIVPVGDFAFQCADRAVRQYAPAAFREAGLPKQAGTLAALPPIVDRETALRAASAARAARAAAYAAAAAAHAAYSAYSAAYAAYAADAAYAAYDAADAAYDAADANTYERALQVEHLHGLWPAVAAACGFEV